MPTTTPVADTLAAPVARTNANIRSGPSLTYPVVDTVLAGTALSIRARTPAGDWLLLDSGGWIYAELVANAPAVPVASSLPVSAATAATAMPVVSSPVPAATQIPAAEIPTVAPGIGGGGSNAFTCIGGCATPPDPSCAIKGNVNSSGEKIYHTPGQRDYNRTDIKTEEGDRWFCTPEEAQAAGFRPAQR